MAGIEVASAQANGASPDTAQDARLETIVVTAERRAESVQNTPIAVDVFGAEALQAQQIVNLQDLSQISPALSFGAGQGNARIFIRGIGLNAISPGSDSRVAIYTDGVYNARTQAASGSFYDLDHVEVLEGPQGTLYGRNATAGAINIISRDPGDSFDGYAKLTAGNYALVQAEGAAGGPLMEGVSARVAFQTLDHTGYGHDITTGNDVDDALTRAVRVKLKYDGLPNFKFLLEGDYFKEHDHSGSYHFLGNTPGNESFGQAAGFSVPTNRLDIAGTQPNYELENYGVSGTATANLGGTELTSISAYRDLRSFIAQTADETSDMYLPNNSLETSQQFSEELRVARSIGPVDALLGGYYFHEANFGGNDAPISGAYFGLPPALTDGAIQAGNQETNAHAVFTQETVHLTDALGIDLGVRYSFEKRRMVQYSAFELGQLYTPGQPFFNPNPALTSYSDQSVAYSATDPKAAIHYQVTHDILAYVSYSKGFQSGGFNFTTIQPPFAPETITDYEGGVKADFFDHRFRANLSGFVYDYKNLQVNLARGITLVTTNAAAADLYGAEGDFTMLPTPDLRLEVNLAWLHSAFTNYMTADPGRPLLGTLNLAGNPLAYAPDLKAEASVGYTFHPAVGDITPRASATWTDRIYFDQFKLDYVGQAPWTDVDLYLDYVAGSSGWSASAYIHNLTDHFYEISSTVSSNFIGYNLAGLVGPPRTFGVSVTKKF